MGVAVSVRPEVGRQRRKVYLPCGVADYFFPPPNEKSLQTAAVKAAKRRRFALTAAVLQTKISTRGENVPRTK